MDLSLQIFLIHYISSYGYDEAFQLPISWLLFRIWSPKWQIKSHSGACIRRNFTPCASSENLVLDQPENPQTYIVLYSHHCLTDIVFICYCKEKFCLGHSWELIKG